MSTAHLFAADPPKRSARVVEISDELNASLAEPAAPMEAAAEPLELEPGIHRDLTMAQYLALPYMSASKLEPLGRSPLQLKHALTAEREETDPLARGTALHLAILEPLLFEGRYVTIGQCEGVKKGGDPCKYQGSVYRDGASYCKTHDPEKGEPMAADVEVLKQPDYEAVLGMRDAILANPRARSLFEGKGEFEVTIIFDDPETGVRCKTRPDRLVERAGMLVDLKSTRDAVEHAFAGDAERRGYWRKMALYRRALHAIDWPYKETAVVAVESSAPYDLIPYLLDPKDLDSAEVEVSRLLRTYRTCREDDVWPGYTGRYDTGFATLRRPAWASGEDRSDA